MYVGELLPVVVLHDEIRFAFLDRPGRREAARKGGRWRPLTSHRVRVRDRARAAGSSALSGLTLSEKGLLSSKRRYVMV